MNFLKKFYNNFISVKLSDYNGFESELQINKLLFFIFLGICAACIIITYHNTFASLLLKKLTRTDAFGEENSKSLSELGLGDSRMVKTLLKAKSGALKSIIATKDDKKLSYEEYDELMRAKKGLRRLSKEERKAKMLEINNTLSPALNFDEARFYIPSDMKDASERFIADKSTTLARGFISCGVILAFYIVIALLMPSLLSFISGIITK